MRFDGAGGGGQSPLAAKRSRAAWVKEMMGIATADVSERTKVSKFGKLFDRLQAGWEGPPNGGADAEAGSRSSGRPVDLSRSSSPEQQLCEECGAAHDGMYGSGRFCGDSCRFAFGAKKAARVRMGEEVARTGRWVNSYQHKSYRQHYTKNDGLREPNGRKQRYTRAKQEPAAAAAAARLGSWASGSGLQEPEDVLKDLEEVQTLQLLAMVRSGELTQQRVGCWWSEDRSFHSGTGQFSLEESRFPFEES